jgi:hypothetical protein
MMSERAPSAVRCILLAKAIIRDREACGDLCGSFGVNIEAGSDDLPDSKAAEKQGHHGEKGADNAHELRDELVSVHLPAFLRNDVTGYYSDD